ncbi:hypothetical protein SAY87_011836 [Trapa incisa]|uniref:TFIIS central domain-containing protein n=1 Tax=Trapa incisa TaxID=236973 RepID=A0AAN7JIJ5_9MYRT|nr:hypothetical protein SAY87_011836 [Trapa incisa]
MMSNHLVSQPLSISGTQKGQLELPNKLEPQTSVMQVGLMGYVPDNPISEPHSTPIQQTEFSGSASKGFGVQKLSSLGNCDGEYQNRDKVVGSQHFIISSETLEVINMLDSKESSHLSATNKRKAPMVVTENLSPRSSSIPFKRSSQLLEHRPWMVQQSASSGRVVPIHSIQQVPGVRQMPGQAKKLAHMDSISPRPTSQHAPIHKSQFSVQSSAKGVSFDTVRSKMRESLASALALVSSEASKPPISRKSSQAEALFIQNPTNAPGGVGLPYEESKDILICDEGSNDQNLIGDKLISQEAPGINDDAGPTMALASNIQDFQSDNTLSTDDVPFGELFFVKDELLQGNGLSWVLEPNIGVVENDIIRSVGGKGCIHQQVDEIKTVIPSSEELAFKIEAELYKLFGGVNKKYKEKGRSLLFNLKDPNNPELRERVVSGEIPPERLCSMTAEELASKELSEWRMAKAEELAQMVVLPDSEVDMRRLVKKTHKGEFQVEVEQDDSISVEVSLGGSSIRQSRSRPKNKSPQRKANEINEGNAEGGRTKIADKGTNYTLTIPSDDQESEVDIMVDDAVGNLPPIVTLDEFMESLDSEPPFEDLQVNSEKIESQSPVKDLEADTASKSIGRSPEVADGDVSDKSGKVDENLSTRVDEKSRSSGRSESRSSPVISKDEEVWEGYLQLSVSSTVSILGGFKSGERTSAKQWTSAIEIKGRVKLDAFEKFLQDLRMSKKRAIMVVHFLCKEGSSENERASICELVDSYVLDERVGVSYPSDGVELYFCPPHPRTREMLSKILPKEQIQALDAIDSGLIGVVIWRRPQFTTSTATEHPASKKQLRTTSTSKSRHKQDSRFDPSLTIPYHSRFSSSARVPSSYNANSTGVDDNDNDDDDVPPGFGPPPGASQDMDDLPEFTFSSSGSNPRAAAQGHQQAGSCPSRASRPVDKIRELIHKYGQPGAQPSSLKAGLQFQPWNDDEDDDDDIPEWRPDGLGGQRIKSSSVPRNLAGHQFSQDRGLDYPSTAGQVGRLMAAQQQHGSWSSSPSDRVNQSYGQPQGRAASSWRQDGHRGGGY